ncbi:MAG: LLM class flavin-dependent oxidoreductase [Sphingomonadaceae bacterium]|nr:LLM class flavin-dependent oxidoreductase [Sphingomonadaceae bacterium]
MLEIWRAGGANSGATPEFARATEAEGWDGQMFMDSQCLSADPYAQMGVWACSTERMKLSTGVTNPFTRNLAVTAAGAATIQSISGGRAVLGIGRGDSALAYLGHGPVGSRRFEEAINQLQTLLSGAEIPFDEFGVSGNAPSSDELSLGGRPEAVRLNWLPEGMAKVPLDVAATGPRVIAMGALAAERLTFSVGAEPERMEWAIGVARAARQTRGLGDEGISFGAQLVVVCNSDEDKAMEIAMQIAPPLARFQVIEGKQVGPQGEEAAKNLDAVKSGYDMTRHSDIATKEKIKGGGLSPEFVRNFAVVGNPERVIERLLELRRMGLDRFVVVGPGLYPSDWSDKDRDLFTREVMPALRADA